MKKIFCTIIIALLLATLCLPAFATEAEATAEPVPDQTAPETAAPAPTPADTSGEEYAPLTEMAYRLWNENKELILSGLSAFFSLIVWMLTSKRYIPKINRAVNKLAAGQSTQDEQIAGKLAAFEEKLDQFSNYDAAAKDMQKVLDDCRLDREVLTKVIELQAEQLHNIIEISGLPQVRKDQLYEAYRVQLTEIKRLKGEGMNG